MASVEKAECRLNDHVFVERLLERNVHFYVLSLDGSFFVWIGSSPHQLSNLAVGVQTRFDGSPSGTTIMGDCLDPTSSGLAQKLAKKTQKQVFVSYNLPSTDLMLLPLVEKRLFAEISEKPEKF